MDVDGADIQAWKRRHAGLSDVWPLTPMQSGMLFESIHGLREWAFGLFLRTQTAQQQETLLGEAVNDVAIELPKAIQALYGTIHFISRALLMVVYIVGLLFLSGWMTMISLVRPSAR